jgi:hemerythrin
MITWTESMSTGVALLDAQHKMLFQKFNEFSDAISGGVSAQDAAAEILDFLQFYASWHFGREEQCMDEYKCPVAAHNKQAHAEFMVTFNSFYRQWQDKTINSELVKKTHHELETWLINHVSGTDTQLQRCAPKNTNA